MFSLIHLARCIKFNPKFSPWIVRIMPRGTESNRRINFIPALEKFNRGLVLIGLRTSRAWCHTTLTLDPEAFSLQVNTAINPLIYFRLLILNTLHRRIFQIRTHFNFSVFFQRQFSLLPFSQFDIYGNRHSLGAGV